MADRLGDVDLHFVPCDMPLVTVTIRTDSQPVKQRLTINLFLRCQGQDLPQRIVLGRIPVHLPEESSVPSHHPSIGSSKTHVWGVDEVAPWNRHPNEDGVRRLRHGLVSAWGHVSQREYVEMEMSTVDELRSSREEVMRTTPAAGPPNAPQKLPSGWIRGVTADCCIDKLPR